MKHTKTAKKTIGGLRDVVNDDFKYTLDAGRIEFIKVIYPHLDTIINNLNSINWGSYSYTGPDILTKVFTNLHGDDLDEPTYLKDAQRDDNKVVFLKTVPVYISKTDPIDITYVGGIVYELLNKKKKYNNAVDLLQYCDPTSDIDINLKKIPDQIIETYTNNDIQIVHNKSLPTEGHVITYNKDRKTRVKVDYTDLINRSNELPDNDLRYHFDGEFTFIRNFYDLERKITPYYQHLTKWIFTQFKNCFENDNLAGLRTSDLLYDLEEDDLVEYPELLGLVGDVEQGYLTKKIGKCFLIGFLTRNGGINPEDDILPMDDNARTYKIQLIAKTNGENHKYDHLVEILINFTYDSFETSKKSRNDELWVDSYNGIERVYHQSISKLMSDNILALKTRENFIEDLSTEFIHKAINHINRMLYIIELINQNKTDFFKLNKWGIVFNPASPVLEFYNYIKGMIMRKKKLPIKAYQASDGTISSFEFIDPKNILLSYIMLFVYGIGTHHMINIINYYEQVFKDDIDIMKNNIPKEFTDFKKPTLDTIETVFLKSAYTENQKYNELIGIIKTGINGGKRKKNKRRSKKRRITKKIKNVVRKSRARKV